MNALRQWGGGSVDCLLFTAIISCTLFLSPWFALGLPAMVWLRPAPAVQSATVLRLPVEKPAVDHHTREAA